ncbi:MAG: hypothetical protein Q9P44_21415 [Anaerolineae bacterium]|nr:hypothetical protein [Anaerolineae bacterium]
MILWVLYRTTALFMLILSLMGLVLAYGQSHTDDALLLVVNLPTHLQMRDVIILDTTTGVQYAIWRQQNVERVALSPDKQRLALALLSQRGLTLLNVAQLNDGSNRNQVQDGVSNPVWSPDGQWLAHTGRDFRLEGLYLTNQYGENLHLLLDIDSDGVPVWSPDSRGLAFVTEFDNQNVLQTIDIESGVISTLFSTSACIIQVDWSSQLRLLTANHTILVDVEAQTSTSQQTINLESYGTAYNVRWSPHNNTLAFTARRRAQEVVVTGIDDGQIRRYQIDGLWIVSVDWWQPQQR